MVVAHCLLDANTRLHGLARYTGVHPAIVAEASERGLGIVQLPCPEVAHCGMKRWAASREQYDTVGYRRLCRDLLQPVVDTLAELVADGVVIEVVYGVAGSPSCGAQTTSSGEGGGRIEGPWASERVAGQGVMIAELESLFASAGIDTVVRDAPELLP